MNRRPKAYKLCGFTLIELLVAVAVASVLLSLAAPNFRDLIQRNQKDTAIYTLLGDLRFARSEAIKQSTRLSVCARKSATECGTAWDNGWLVYVDNGPVPGTIETGETVIRQHQGPAEGVAINNLARIQSGTAAPIDWSYVRFGPRGTSNWRGGGTFTICLTNNSSSVDAVNVSMSGDIRQARKDGSDDLINSFGGKASCEAPAST